jgi:site-specific recombinase XerD
VRAYTSDLREFLKAAGENQTVTQEEYEELAMSYLNLYRFKVSPKTTARRLTSIRGFAKWAGWGRVLDEYIAPTPGKTIPHPISEGMDGVERMIAQAKNHQQVALVAFGAEVGMRISESLSTTIHHFDLETMLLTIRGKGDKTRVVPVSERAWTHLMPAYALAMSKEDGRLISYKDRFARQIVTQLGVRAKLKAKVSSHDLRATFATDLLDKGVHLRVVQELLGHASSDTTEIYTGVSMDSMRKAVNI